MNALFREIAALPTEQNNPASSAIDAANTLEILAIMNDEDCKVPAAVRSELPYVARAVDMIVEAFSAGGRLIYTGAGTSGRLGILDASECPPTFGTPPELVQGLIAGGSAAVFRSQEGAEDRPEDGARAVAELGVSSCDVVCGIAASGRTPYVVGALAEAQKRGATTVLVTTNSREQLRALGVTADVMICPNVGPEVVTGSTRMKSGTAQKLVLNMLTTASMIRMGKTYGNVMVDLQMTNDKLRERARRVLMETTGADYDTASTVLAAADGHVKTAIVMILGNTTRSEAIERLEKAGGFVRRALQHSVAQYGDDSQSEAQQSSNT